MDREILFRGKRINNGELVEGFYIPIGKRAYIICKVEISDLYATEWYEVDSETVCQYTGLTDKNGRKIFERDIVKHNSCLGIVKFGKYNFSDYGYHIEWLSKNSSCYANCFLHWLDYEENRIIEVIGNIFDNPELLEAEA